MTDLEFMNQTIFTNSFSNEVWEGKYKFGDEITINDTFKRVANAIASQEKDKEYWLKRFYNLLSDFHFTPGGRITSNAGVGLKGTTLMNCYVESFTGEDQDSIEGIYNGLFRQAKTLQSEGGYGFCANVMRPKGSHIAGIGNQSPGSVKFLELWDKSSEIITSGSGNKANKGEKNSIRKGAQMVTLSCWHPDIEEFIDAKKTPGRLTKFNMSVLISDQFMKAVENNEDWNLVFPNYKDFSKLYKKKWDGNLNKWVELAQQENSKIPAVLVHRTVKARELWELIMSNTYNRNEPGVLYEDTINRLNNLRYIEYILATNPCGEQPMAPHSVCLLGSINLTKFINKARNDWDYDKLKEFIPDIVRFLDNVNDISNCPLPEQLQSMKEKRRIGCGVIGYASALLMMKVKYGSKKALTLTDKLMDFICNNLYQSSALLAKEKGSFALYDKEKYLQSEFLKVLSPETLDMIKKYGIRNSHLSSMQPTGNSSVFANNISSGIEPIFSAQYYRTVILHHVPEGISIPKNIDWDNKIFNSESHWEWTKEGDESILLLKHNNEVYKFDRNRGLTKEELVEDYGVYFLKQNNEWDESADWAYFANDLKTEDHINPLSIFAKYVDAAISKTINLPKDYSYEDFKHVYWNAWKAGIKGCTTYRAGTMTNVLSVESTSNKQNTEERPKELNCELKHITVKGQPYFVLVGLLNNKPYELFAGKNGFMGKKHTHGVIIKKKSGVYKAVLNDDFELSPITDYTTDDEDVICRLVSAALRNGTDIKQICEQLSKSKGDLTNISKGIARVLSKYIDDGEESGEKCPECAGKLIYQSGCKSCPDCGYAACG